MRLIGRIIAVLLILLMIPTTAMAFWLFNADRVATDPAAYKNALQTGFAYTDFLAAITESFSHEGVPRRADAVLMGITPDVWPLITPQLMPPESARKLVNTNIDAIFNWIDGTAATLQTGLDLSDLKSRLSDKYAVTAVDTIVAHLPRCTTDAAAQIDSFSSLDSFTAFPLCNPTDDTQRVTAKTQWVAALGLIGQHMPSYWNMMSSLNSAATISPPNFGDPGSGAPPLPNSPPGGSRPPPLSSQQRIDPLQLEQGRAIVWLEERLRVLLFLIPVALMCLVVIVTVRSGKGFFRWLSWALILSGFFSLIPVLILPLFSASVADPRTLTVVERLGTGGQALKVLARGMIQSIISSLTLSVLLQVAALIVVGLIAAFISVLIAPPEPELTEAELHALFVAQNNILTPAPSSVTPMP